MHINVGTQVVWLDEQRLGRVVVVIERLNLVNILWSDQYQRGFPVDPWNADRLVMDPWNADRLVMDPRKQLAFLIADDCK